ncbi:MAG: hypothetical protein HC892_11370 [Saprospiraceae bacterium]|nr:hypothetical protein [Saprospiraceae bacterium]
MRPLTRKELAKLYGYGCTKTFTRRLAKRDVFITPRKLLDMDEQVVIFAYLGIPPLLCQELQAVFQPLVKQYCEKHDLHDYQ